MGIQLLPPLFLTPEKDALYMRGFVPRKLEKFEAPSLAGYFHFDPAQHSPCLRFSVNPDSLLPAILHCSTIGAADPRVTLSAALIEKSSGQTTPLTLFVLSEEKEGSQSRFLVNVHIPELSPGEYTLQFTAAERATKSASQTTKDFQVN
jgi:hypothetical protein